MKIYNSKIIQPVVYRSVVTKTNTQSISNNSGTAITWDTVVEDPLGLVNLGVSSSKFDFTNLDFLSPQGRPVNWSAILWTNWPQVSGTTGGFQPQIRVNGAHFGAGTSFTEHHDATVVSNQWCAVRTFSAAGTNYIEGYAYQNTGAAVNLQGVHGGTPSSGQTAMIVYVYWNG